APRPQLEAPLPVHAERTEAERLVQGDARGVGQRDVGVGRAVALEPEDREERAVETAADPGSMAVPPDVHREIDRPLIRRPFAEAPGIGIAEDVAVILAHKPRPADS